MTLYAVLREAGPAWTDGKVAFEQLAVDHQPVFMGMLADEGFLVFAGADCVVSTRSASSRWLRPFFSRSARISIARRMARSAFS